MRSLIRKTQTKILRHCPFKEVKTTAAPTLSVPLSSPSLSYSPSPTPLPPLFPPLPSSSLLSPPLALALNFLFPFLSSSFSSPSSLSPLLPVPLCLFPSVCFPVSLSLCRSSYVSPLCLSPLSLPLCLFPSVSYPLSSPLSLPLCLFLSICSLLSLPCVSCISLLLCLSSLSLPLSLLPCVCFPMFLVCFFSYAEVGKVTLKSNGDETLSRIYVIKKSNSNEALNSASL
jgi:hypothetical protein